MSLLRRPLSVAVLVVLVGACTDVPPATPTVTGVTPAAIPELLEAELTISGENLFVRTRTDFTQGTSERTGEYRVTLRDGNAEVSLPVTAHPNASSLRVRVPAGVARGRYALTLEDPWEREVSLENAVRLMGPCETPTGPAPGDACEGADSDKCVDEIYECVAGVLTCISGADDVEVCDGVDNDCDPATADGAAEPTLGDVCEGPDGDLCSDDTVTCEAGVLACGAGSTNAELCDGVDNDCNPDTADGSGEPTLGQSCDGADSDACLDDTWACTPDGMACTVGAANAELCDGVDNDCDPSTADGAQDPQLGTACDGSDSDLCQDDTRQCTGGALVCSVGAANPELCDGADNDCNPATVDGSQDPAVGQACDGADTDFCEDDTRVCSGGALSCSLGTNTPDLCNGADDDCNPATGDGSGEATYGQACDGPDLDSCTEGTRTCDGTAMVCTEAPEDFCGVAMKVGTFAKATGAAPVNQVIAHGLGATPKAILFWTVGSIQANASSPSYVFSMGMVDQDRSGMRSHAAATADNANPGSSARRYADAALTLLLPEEVTTAQADLISWDETSFTLRWTTNDTQARRIHFLAIAGANVSSKVVKWQMPSAATTGNQAVTGAGFAPTALINFSSGTDVSSTPPQTVAFSVFSLSAADSATSEFSTSIAEDDGVSYPQSYRTQRNRFINLVSSGGSITKAGDLTSLNSDGFTVNWSSGSSGGARMSALALAGVQSKVLCFDRATTTGTQTVTGFPFRPMAVLFSSFQTAASTVVQANAYLGVGASDGTTSGASAFASRMDFASSLVVRRDSDAAYLEVGESGALLAQANLTGFTSNGFTLNWTTTDGSAGEICAIAFAP